VINIPFPLLVHNITAAEIQAYSSNDPISSLRAVVLVSCICNIDIIDLEAGTAVTAEIVMP
jgi:hypothetical protein